MRNPREAQIVEREVSSEMLLVAPGAALFQDRDGRLRRSTFPGHTAGGVWYAPPGRQIVSSPVLRDGRVYVAVSGLGLVCLKGQRDR
jgi:hypothetical protein